MYASRIRNGLKLLALAGVGLAPLLLPGGSRAQEVEIVSKEVAVGTDEAALRLELSDGVDREFALRRGTVFVDGDPLGSYLPGGALDEAWRSLLGDAVALDDGPLARRLTEWAPPPTLEGDALDMAARLDLALEQALEPRSTPEARPEETPEVRVNVGGGAEGILRVLLSQASRLGELEAALEGLDVEGALALHVQEDVEVPEGEVVEGALVVIQGDVRIRGTVDGDVVVVDGTLEILPGGAVRGDVRLVDARVVRDAGEVEGRVVDVGQAERLSEYQIRDELRAELQRELQGQARGEGRSHRSGWGPFSAIAAAVGGLVEHLLLILLLAVVGVGVVAFAGDNLSTVAEAARREPGRAAMVGMAGSLLLVPVWVLGTIALAVSIVGIPVMIAWLPLFPLAALAAGVLGYLAVAHNAGEWLSESGIRYTEWIRGTNPVYTVTGGLLALMLFFVAADVLRLVPFVGAIRGLLQFAGLVVTFVAVQIGFGAVLLTRGGRKPEYSFDDGLDAAWEAAVDADRDVGKENDDA